MSRRSRSIESTERSSDLNGDGYPDLTIQHDGSPLGPATIWTWLGGPDGLVASRCSVTPAAP